MSHFTVLVVVRDAESPEHAEAQLDDLLEPFNENLEVAPFVSWVDSTDRAVALFRENPDLCDGEQGPSMPFDAIGEGNLEAWIEWQRQAVGGYHASDANVGVYDAESNRFGYMSTFNTDAQWDWWALGGRWHGFFQVKPGVRVGAEPVPEWRKALARHTESHEGSAGMEPVNDSHHAILGLSGVGGDDPSENFTGRADLARKGDIDFAAMRDLAGHRAEAQYDAFERATAGIEVATRWNDLVKFHLVEANVDPEASPQDLADDPALDERRKVAINAARESFRSHPWVQALTQHNLEPFMEDLHDFWCVHDGGREAFVRRARDGAVQTHAVLLDGTWHEQGSMVANIVLGWFGMVHNEKDPSLWAREYTRLLDNLPDDCWLAVVDCHI